MIAEPVDLPVVYSIGHSNQSLESFIGLLKRHGIDVVVDTRSYPVSRYAPQFNRSALEQCLPRHDIGYRFLGVELGGRPQQPDYYDDQGHVLYSRVAEADFFRKGIALIERGVDRRRIALMCSEENPTDCHRRLLIGRVLAGRGITMVHIRADGRLEPEAEYTVGRGAAPADGHQFSLFGEPEKAAWRSTQSVLRRSPPASSSEH